MSCYVKNGWIYDGRAVPFIPEGKEEKATVFLHTPNGEGRFIFHLGGLFPAKKHDLKVVMDILMECPEREIKKTHMMEFLKTEIEKTDKELVKINTKISEVSLNTILEDKDKELKSLNCYKKRLENLIKRYSMNEEYIDMTFNKKTKKRRK